MFNNDSPVPRAEVIIIGNEVTSGLIAETNSRTISLRLNEKGIDVSRITSVGDDPGAIKGIVNQALNRVDLVITTGGLGPTHDDITKRVVTDLFEGKLVRDERVVAMIEEFFRKRGRNMPQYALAQSEVPNNADVLLNEKGSAPGLLFRHRKKSLYLLPGVPLEMEHLLEKYILPEAALRGTKIGHRRLKTTGITESALWGHIKNMKPLQDILQVASLPSHLGVTLRLSTNHEDPLVIQERLDRGEVFFREKIGSYIFGKDDDSMEAVVGRLLRERGLKLATAESCTGGLIGNRVTNVSGSSDYFLEGFVTYTNESKIRRLGVKPELFENYGAVSREVAIAMAEGARQNTGADLTLAVTGIAGPTGGSATKPVGLTYISLSAERTCECEMFVFPQDRIYNKERAAQAALNMLRLWLVGQSSL